MLPSGAIRSISRSPRLRWEMFTLTVELTLALPEQVLIEMELVTAAPPSGIDNGVLLVPGTQTGGGPAGPANSSWFGEPAPGLVTLFAVEALTSASRTCCAVKPGLSPRISAATPAT